MGVWFSFCKHKDKFESEYTHHYKTRTLDLNCPIHRLTLAEKLPYYMCIRLYNKLPNYCRMFIFTKFKKVTKKMLIVLEPYSVEDYLNCDYLMDFI